MLKFIFLTSIICLPILIFAQEINEIIPKDIDTISISIDDERYIKTYERRAVHGEFYFLREFVKSAPTLYYKVYYVRKSFLHPRHLFKEGLLLNGKQEGLWIEETWDSIHRFYFKNGTLTNYFTYYKSGMKQIFIIGNNQRKRQVYIDGVLKEETIISK